MLSRIRCHLGLRDTHRLLWACSFRPNTDPYLGNPFGYVLTELIGAFEMLNQLGQETQDAQRKPWVREDTTEM